MGSPQSERFPTVQCVCTFNILAFCLYLCCFWAPSLPCGSPINTSVSVHPFLLNLLQRRIFLTSDTGVLDCVWNVMAHAQKPDVVFRRNGRVHLNRQGRQFSRLLAAELCASALVMLDTPCSVVVWRVLATLSIRQFHLHFPSRASPCAIRFQTHSTSSRCSISVTV
jgi:hypothetical protein